MDTTRLGRTGLRVSRLCLGTMNFGPRDERAGLLIGSWTARSTLGCYFFDTANVYGGRTPRGPTEQIIGRWLAQGGGRREKTVLATKVYGQMWRRPNGRGSRRCTCAAPARTACGACRPTTSTCTRCTTSTGTRPGTRSGRRWSCSCSRARCCTSARATSRDGTSRRRTRRRRGAAFLGLVSEQSLYNLARADRRARGPPGVPRLRRSGVLPWSPLGGGLLGGALQKAADGRRGTARIAGADRAAARRSSSAGSGSAASSGTSPRTSRSPGCCTNRP